MRSAAISRRRMLSRKQCFLSSAMTARKSSASFSLSKRNQSTDMRLQLGKIGVDVVRKNIKNVHLSVHPPTGRVRIAAPERMSLDTVRVFAIAKLPWIKSQQKKLSEQER